MQINNDQLGPEPDSAMSVGSWDYGPLIMQSPCLESPIGRFPPVNRNGHHQQSITQFQNSLDTHFFNDDPMTACSDPSGLRVNSLTSPEDSSESNLLLPSLREIRELNSASLSPLSSFFDISKPEKDQSGDNNSRTLVELQAFSSAIFATQADIAGIASAVAEYLAWVRKLPGMPRKPNCAAVLDILETRVRELHEMAETRHWAAWRQTLERLDVTGTESSTFETEIRNRIAETAEYFHARYDIARAMEEQRPGQPPLV